ncbi:Predicted 2-oxoglutarate- and Fe(II)-dependent dioxygenase YbiX [Quadrisphaera granulorum]|uniref:Putative 2-oxoglutarate/Fe(II)-dependent dioxygenase YbiX n=1 Tax=Quadrisphaera granulorum TaxID=317664 RepID=A0A315ZMX2_9ACTN|nr:2OG-Fe(II) oxygenase [Quadrisphaera granulorum]PWJ46856.1 putative 2-oxoglutarate/Fe(II)-dependent dioxygenase YbiX [Quadrisphaera granulorum]SZE99023.1 Predicted 2-oxoglutarate- and Fe(II)-dependent dioxygenase YbiX [Quadrisphaera granulorum]
MVSLEPREHLAILLREQHASAPSALLVDLEPDHLHVDVSGLGTLDLPVTAATAKSLRALGAPAVVGRRERTLHDTTVRDSTQLPASAVRVTWSDDALRDLLVRATEHLELPAGTVLIPELHALLVYGPGQFFTVHQDSEKDDAMVATLVVTLPSRHTGGELVVHHDDGSLSAKGSRTRTTAVVFHADRHHEVTPVKTGYRVSLTYNLLARAVTARDFPAASEPPPQTPQPGGPSALTDLVREHFASSSSARWTGPLRLAYLLDHEYTERSLAWGRLKGADRSRVERLLAAADRAGCTAVLGLAQVQETWDTVDADPRWSRHRWYDHEDDDPDAAYIEPEQQPTDLVDSTVSISHWVNRDGTAAPVRLVLSEEEVCASTASSQLQPYDTEQQGYMGNYGNTLDRWYRRAAVVLWPHDDDVAVRAEADPAWAARRILTRANDGDVDGARRDASALAPFWDAAARDLTRDGADPAAAGDLLRAAAALDDGDLARMLVRPLSVVDLGVEHAGALAELAQRYGIAWSSVVVDGWTGRNDTIRGFSLRREPAARIEWLSTFPALAAALREANPSGDELVGAQLVNRLVVSLWPDVRAALVKAAKMPGARARASRLSDVAPAVVALLLAVSTRASGGADGADDVSRVVREVVSLARQHAEPLLDVLRAASAAAQRMPPEQRERAGFAELARIEAEVLRERLARPARTPGDWALPVPSGCGCAWCAELATFLRNPAAKRRDWPLAEPGRKHVHARIDAAELPVRHETLRAGRPYTLVLTKDPAIFDDDAATRAEDTAQLERLFAGGLLDGQGEVL